MRTICRLVIAGIAAGSLVAAVGLADEKPPPDLTPKDVEPSAAETLILEYVNRARGNPVQEAERLLPMAKGQRGVDTAMFVREMKALKAVPPLVFDARLIWVARMHSQYQIEHGQGHDQTEGKRGFFGRTLKDRLRYARVSYKYAGENCYLYSRNPWHGHGKFIIDTSSTGSGGMRAGRGHRVNIYEPTYRLVGISWVTHKWGKRTRHSMTQDFVRRSRRYAGGVVYTDRNKNRFYDVGEGVEDATVTVAGKTVKVWKSGAYTISIPPTKTEIVFRVGKYVFRGSLPAGKENVKSDVILTPGKPNTPVMPSDPE